MRQVVRNVYSRRQDFGSKCALSREQQLSVLIAEFMKRRYEFRFNVQTGEAEFRERHSFCFRFQPVDKRALNSIALDAQAEGIPLWDRDISRYVYSNRVPVYNPLEDFCSTFRSGTDATASVRWRRPYLVTIRIGPNCSIAGF